MGPWASTASSTALRGPAPPWQLISTTFFAGVAVWGAHDVDECFVDGVAVRVDDVSVEHASGILGDVTPCGRDEDLAGKGRIACDPLRRTIPIPPSPGGVDMAGDRVFRSP